MAQIKNMTSQLSYNQLTVLAKRMTAKSFSAAGVSQKALSKIVAKNYFHQHKSKYQIAHFFSIILNLVSFLSAAYGLYTLGNVEHISSYIILAVGVIALGGFELLKRYVSDGYWDKYFYAKQYSIPLLGAWLFLFSISCFLSSFGVQRANTDLSAPDPALLAINSQLQEKKKEKNRLIAEINAIKENPSNYVKSGRDKGMLRYNYEKQTTTLTQNIETLNNAIGRLETKIGTNTKYLTADYKQRVSVNGWMLIALFLSLELFFQVCMSYRSYFDYRVLLDTNAPAYLKYLEQIRQEKDMEEVDRIEQQLKSSMANFQ